MMKCDMCYDRTSARASGRCAPPSVPSGALAFTTIEEIMRTRQGRAVNEWQFGDQHVRTKVFVLVPDRGDARGRRAVDLPSARSGDRDAAGRFCTMSRALLETGPE